MPFEHGAGLLPPIFQASFITDAIKAIWTFHVRKCLHSLKFLHACLSVKWYWQSFFHSSRSSVRVPSSGHTWPRLTRSLPSERRCMMFSCRLTGRSVRVMPVFVGWKRDERKEENLWYNKDLHFRAPSGVLHCRQMLTLLIWMLSSCCCHCRMFSIRCTQMLMFPTSTDLPMSWTSPHSETYRVCSSSLMGRTFCWSSRTVESWSTAKINDHNDIMTFQAK